LRRRISQPKLAGGRPGHRRSCPRRAAHRRGGRGWTKREIFRRETPVRHGYGRSDLL